jgi:hypothetical protein
VCSCCPPSSSLAALDAASSSGFLPAPVRQTRGEHTSGRGDAQWRARQTSGQQPPHRYSHSPAPPVLPVPLRSSPAFTRAVCFFCLRPSDLELGPSFWLACLAGAWGGGKAGEQGGVRKGEKGKGEKEKGAIDACACGGGRWIGGGDSGFCSGCGATSRRQIHPLWRRGAGKPHGSRSTEEPGAVMWTLR